MLFAVSLVVPISGHFRYKLLKFLAILLNTLILLFHVYNSSYMAVYMPSKSLSVIVTISNCFPLMHRYVLARRYVTLKRIANIMSNYKIREDVRHKLAITFFLALSVTIQIFTIVIGMYYNRSAYLIRNILGIPEGTIALDNTLLIFYYYYITFLMNLPICTFAAFYVLLCYHLRCLLKQPVRLNLPNKDFLIKVLHSISSLHGTIQTIDDKLSIFILFLSVNVSLTVMFHVSSMLRHSSYYTSCVTCIDRIDKYVSMGHAVIILLAVTISASLVHEAYDKLRFEVRRSIEFSTNENLKFITYIDKEAYLTVYKIVQIRRSFIVGMLGGVVTYMLLLDNMLDIG